MPSTTAMTPDDWPAVCAIFREGLRTGLAAFAEHPPSWEAWDAGHLPVGRLAARDDEGLIIGWAALTPVPDT